MIGRFVKRKTNSESTCASSQRPDNSVFTALKRFAWHSCRNRTQSSLLGFRQTQLHCRPTFQQMGRKANSQTKRFGLGLSGNVSPPPKTANRHPRSACAACATTRATFDHPQAVRITAHSSPYGSTCIHYISAVLELPLLAVEQRAPAPTSRPPHQWPRGADLLKYCHC